MSDIVLDASAILAYLQQEPGMEKVAEVIFNQAIASTVNLAEAHTKLVKRGLSSDDSWEHVLSTVKSAVPFTVEHARIVGDLIKQTEKLGLSMGDRACLALAISLKAPVYTTEKIWRNLKLGIKIHVIR